MHFAPEIDHPVLKSLFRFWVEAREDQPLPPPERIDLSLLPDRIRRHAVLYHAEGPPEAPEFRLDSVGADLTVRYGHDSTGKLITEVLTGHQVEVVQRVLESVMRDRVVHSYRTMVTLAGGGAVPYSKLLMPLGTVEGGATGVLGGLIRRDAADADLEQNYQSRFASIDVIEDRPSDFT